MLNKGTLHLSFHFSNDSVTPKWVWEWASKWQRVYSNFLIIPNIILEISSSWEYSFESIEATLHFSKYSSNAAHSKALPLEIIRNRFLSAFENLELLSARFKTMLREALFSWSFEDLSFKLWRIVWMFLLKSMAFW